MNPVVGWRAWNINEFDYSLTPLFSSSIRWPKGQPIEAVYDFARHCSVCKSIKTDPTYYDDPSHDIPKMVEICKGNKFPLCPDCEQQYNAVANCPPEYDSVALQNMLWPSVGIWAYKQKKNLLQIFTENYVETYQVFGEVSLWGWVKEHEVGYRAKFGYPKKLYKHSSLPLRLLQKLCREYGCEIEPNDTTLV